MYYLLFFFFFLCVPFPGLFLCHFLICVYPDSILFCHVSILVSSLEVFMTMSTRGDPIFSTSAGGREGPQKKYSRHARCTWLLFSCTFLISMTQSALQISLFCHSPVFCVRIPRDEIDISGVATVFGVFHGASTDGLGSIHRSAGTFIALKRLVPFHLLMAICDFVGVCECASACTCILILFLFRRP